MDLPLIIFSDLDGTLLDHDSYSFEGARRALQRLHEHAIPLILTTSKTRAELESLQKQLKLAEPFIVENGGGLFIPDKSAMLPHSGALEKWNGYYRKLFGKPYPYIRKIFKKLQSTYNIKGFGDMTVAEIMAATGLNREAALLARERDFSEPFLFQAGSSPDELAEEAAGYGLKITRGGRFFHLMAAGQDKGRAVAETLRLFQGEWGDKIISVGLGDAENDYPMLKTVDIPVLIPKPDGSYEKFDLPGLRQAPYPGSRGWGSAVTDILNECRTASSPSETR